MGLTDWFRRIFPKKTTVVISTPPVSTSTVKSVDYTTSDPSTGIVGGTTTATTTIPTSSGGGGGSSSTTTVTSVGTYPTVTDSGTVINVADDTGTTVERQYYQDSELVFTERGAAPREGRVTGFSVVKDDGFTTLTETRDPNKPLTVAQLVAKERALEERDLREQQQSSGVVFLKEGELAERGVGQTPAQEFFFPTKAEQAVIYSEEIIGMDQGSSGAGAVAEIDLNLKSRGPIALAGSGIHYVSGKFADVVPGPKEFVEGLEGRDVKFFEEHGGDLTSPVSDTFDVKAKEWFVGGIEEYPGTAIAIPFAIGGAVGTGFRIAGKTALKYAPKIAPRLEGLAQVAGITVGSIFLGKTLQHMEGLSPGSKGALFAEVTTELVAFGAGLKVGMKAFDAGLDFYRKRGTRTLPTVTTEVPFTRYDRDVFFERDPLGRFKEQKFDIIAPEYRAGQKYPAIRSGQSQGSLMSEFYKPILPGETLGTPRSFSAAPVEFKPNDIILPGSSYVKGGFSAPKLSPTFLRITSRESNTLFSSEGLFGSSPTAHRFTLGELSLARGKPSQTRLNPADARLRKYFEGLEGTGKTALPFGKAEKEAVTGSGSRYVLTDRRFNFKFEGRTVIIPEAKILPAELIPKGKKSYSQEEYIDLISSGNRPKPSYTARSSIKVGGYSSISSSMPSSSAISSSLSRGYSRGYSRPYSSTSLSSSMRSSSSSLRSSLSSYGSSISSYSSGYSSGGSSGRGSGYGKSAPPIIPLPLFGQLTPAASVVGKRKFKRTPSIGAALKYDFTGFGGGTTKGESTGLVERGFKFKVPKIEVGSLLKGVSKL